MRTLLFEIRIHHIPRVLLRQALSAILVLLFVIVIHRHGGGREETDEGDNSTRSCGRLSLLQRTDGEKN